MSTIYNLIKKVGYITTIICLTVFTSSVNAQSWHKPIDGNTYNNFIGESLFGSNFLNSTNGFAVGTSGTIVATADAGETWKSKVSSVTTSLYSVNFSSTQKGWAVGQSGVILHSSNSGDTWTNQTSGTTQTLRTVFFCF